MFIWLSAHGTGIAIGGIDQAIRHIRFLSTLRLPHKPGSGNCIIHGEEQELTVDLGAMRRRPNWIRPQTERNWRMRSGGYKEEDIKGIMGRNWRRFLERALPAYYRKQPDTDSSAETYYT